MLAGFGGAILAFLFTKRVEMLWVGLLIYAADGLWRARSAARAAAPAPSSRAA